MWERTAEWWYLGPGKVTPYEYFCKNPQTETLSCLGFKFLLGRGVGSENVRFGVY